MPNDKDLFRQIYENNVPVGIRKAIVHCANQFREVLGMNENKKKKRTQKKKKKKTTLTSDTKKRNPTQRRSQSTRRAPRSKQSRRQT